MQCNRCGAPLQRGAAVCHACGSRQPRATPIIRCRQCGKRAKASLTVCPHCGQALIPARLPARRTIALAAVIVVMVVLGITRLPFNRATDVLLALIPTIATPTLTPSTGPAVFPNQSLAAGDTVVLDNPSISQEPAPDQLPDALALFDIGASADITDTRVITTGQVVTGVVTATLPITGSVVMTASLPTVVTTDTVPTETVIVAGAQSDATAPPLTPSPTATSSPTSTPPPTATPSPTHTPPPTATPTSTHTPLPTATASPSATSSPTVTPPPTATPSATRRPKDTDTPTVAPTRSLGASPTPPTATPTYTPRPSATPTVTPRPSATPTVTPPPTATPTPTRVVKPGAPLSYTIRPGDTVAAIASRYGTTIAAVLALNPGLNPSRLQVGTVIQVPGPAGSAPTSGTPAATPTGRAPTATPTARPGTTQTYRIRSGDTLQSIANANRTTVAALMALNPGINPSRLQVGQTIVLSRTAPATPATPTRAVPTTPTQPTLYIAAPVQVAPSTGTPFSGDNTFIELRWQAPTGMDGSLAYLVELGYPVDGSFQWRLSDVVQTTSWVVPTVAFGKADQQTGRRYSWRVTVVSPQRDATGRITGFVPVSPPSSTWEFTWT